MVKEEINNKDIFGIKIKLENENDGEMLEEANDRCQTTVLKSEDIPQYLCTICLKDSTNKSAICSACSLNKKVEFRCQECGKLLSDNANLLRHIRLVHEEPKFALQFQIDNDSFECPTCKHILPSLRKFLRHLKEHKGVKIYKTKHICDICGRVLNSKFALKLHVQAKHTGNPKRKTAHEFNLQFKDDRGLFHCPSCAKTYANTESFTKHRKEHIRGKKMYPCELCGKVISTIASLRDHLKLHAGEKPFKCEFCERAFSKRKTLTVHMVVHTKERPYKCTLCEKTFTQQGPLKQHYGKAHGSFDYLKYKN